MRAIQETANAFDCATQLDADKIKAILNDPSDSVSKLKYVLRYLGIHSWKGTKASELKAILDAGLGLFLFYETNPTHDYYFTYKRGLQDCVDAMQNMEALNAPKGKQVAVIFTVDEGTRDFADVLTYFQAIKKEMKDYLVYSYADYDVTEYLQKHNACDGYIQTYAWSGGKIADNLIALQFKNGQNLGGVNVDLDFVYSDAGAWKATGEVTVHHKTDAAHVTEHTQKYTIQKGDSLWKLETKWDLQHGLLAKLNPQIENASQIYPGEEINIPATVYIKKRVDHIETYLVRKGDTLSKIAKAHGCTVDEILKLNPQIHNRDLIFVGEKIELPDGSHTYASHPHHKYHTVEKDENLSTIAKKYHESLHHLESLNPQIKNPNVIYPGEKIRVR